MKVYYKKGDSILFARKVPYEYNGVQYEADLKNEDIVKILDAGEIEIGKYGEQKNFKIKTRNGEKKLGFNQQTQNVLIKTFGDETKDWIGKDVKVILKKDTIANKKVIIPYLIVDGWELDEYGELVKSGDKIQEEESIEIGEENNPF